MKTSIVDCDDKGRGAGIIVAGFQKSIVCRADQKANKEQSDDVENGDTPEDLLDSAR